MRRVAAALGVGTMSLYWHVPDKETLLDLVVDAVFGEMDLPEEASGDWRADLRRVAVETRRLYRRHPWMAAPQLGPPALGPNFLRHVEVSVGAVESLPVDASTRAHIPAVVDHFVLGFVLQEDVMTTDEWEAVATATPGWEGVIRSGRYPALARLAAEDPGNDNEARFAFGLDSLLDGIAARLGRDEET